MDKRNVQHIFKTVRVQSKRKHNARKRKRKKKKQQLIESASQPRKNRNITVKWPPKNL